ncbi:response regulator transcription factor [Thiomicrorhabdus aquaedulcis]|uniref:response regulator transcription factor n=1 Tax=Thiomicrorhabdus aquaedulcis TaxID=2211106 RepID=UPI000FDA7C5F|nr:response regulator transcription factor [Thiomicrorhabdus aquaedulcis]
MNILFLEDEPDLAEQIQYFLQKRGYCITWVQTLAQTHEYLKNQTFGVLLLDRLVSDGDSVQHLKVYVLYTQVPL